MPPPPPRKDRPMEPLPQEVQPSAAEWLLMGGISGAAATAAMTPFENMTAARRMASDAAAKARGGLKKAPRLFENLKLNVSSRAPELCVAFTAKHQTYKWLEDGRPIGTWRSFFSHFLAGATAGLASCTVMYPAEVALFHAVDMGGHTGARRTVDQQRFGKSLRLVDVIVKTAESQGVVNGLYRHFGVAAAGASLHGALWFGLYDTSKVAVFGSRAAATGHVHLSQPSSDATGQGEGGSSPAGGAAPVSPSQRRELERRAAERHSREGRRSAFSPVTFGGRFLLGYAATAAALASRAPLDHLLAERRRLPTKGAVQSVQDTAQGLLRSRGVRGLLVSAPGANSVAFRACFGAFALAMFDGCDEAYQRRFRYD